GGASTGKEAGAVAGTSWTDGELGSASTCNGAGAAAGASGAGRGLDGASALEGAGAGEGTGAPASAGICSAGISPARAANISTRTVEASLPRRSTVTGP